VGHFFWDRFKSELVMDENYLLQVSVYIHNNPVKAGIVKRPEDYRWSSIHYYLGKQQLKQELVDPSRILDMLSVDRRRAVAAYINILAKLAGI
jgi:putative transposase